MGTPSLGRRGYPLARFFVRRCGLRSAWTVRCDSRSRSMNVSMPIRGKLPVIEGAIATTPARSLEQFRLYLLERMSGAARAELSGSGETAAVNGLRELWEKSDLPASKFADEVATFWELPRLSLQELLSAAD